MPDGWTEQRFYLEVFDAELFAIHRTMILVEQQCTILSDSTATIERAKTDRCEPGQALERAVIELGELMRGRGCPVALRWAPSHKRVEGNEVADS